MKKDLHILLDIDGVLNPLSRFDEESIVVNIDYEKFKIKKIICETLKKWSEIDNVKIVWMSSWQQLSNRINDQLKINYFDVIFDLFKLKSVSMLNQKIEACNLYIKYNHSSDVLVIDDELKTEDIKGGFLISPDSRFGLNSSDLEEIDKIIELHK